MKFGNRKGSLYALLVLLPLLPVSCGGGGGLAGGGTGGTGVGPVTGFGSVIVNGIRYDDRGIDNTNFFDGHGRTKAELAAGMMVKITATGVNDVSGAGTATKIEVLRHVDGPLDDNGVTLGTNRLIVMGQAVVVDTTTVFDNVAGLAAIDNLARAGNRPEIEIHGIADNTGTIHATFLHRWFDNVVTGRDVQVKGTVANLNPARTSFRMGTVSVSVSAPPAGLDNGLFVEARGVFRVSDNTLLATGVTIADPSAGQGGGDLVKAEGYVNRILAAGTQFELVGADGPQRINWSTATTAFKDGTVSDLLTGARIEVEGKRNLDKSVAAAEISFRKPSNLRMDTAVTVPASPPNSLTLFGKTVFVNSLTQYRDSRDGLSTFGAANILTGDTLRVSAFADNSLGTARIVASRVERIGALLSDRNILQGVVESSTAGVNLTILGITVVTLPGTTEFLQADGTPFPGATPNDRQANFYAAITVGRTVVRARGPAASPGSAMNPANEVQIEPVVDN